MSLNPFAHKGYIRVGSEVFPTIKRKPVIAAGRLFVRRLTWKRELARVEAKLKIQNWRMADIENERRVYYECYTNNLQHCSELEAENGRLKEKLAAQKKYVRAANRGAERNAIVSQMLAARLAIRNQQPPNGEICQVRQTEK